jgi:hypothetical protein
MRQTLQLLYYLATQEYAVLSYHTSNMVLAVHSNASYLSKPNAHSRAGGHFPFKGYNRPTKQWGNTEHSAHH